VEITLKEKREEWEKGGVGILVTTLMNGAYEMACKYAF